MNNTVVMAFGLLFAMTIGLGIVTMISEQKLNKKRQQEKQAEHCCHECCGCMCCVEEKCGCCECVGECTCGVCECECHKH